MKKIFLKAKLLLAMITGNVDKFLMKYAAPGIEYAYQIKGFVESPFVGVVVSLTPTKLDDIALATARKYVDVAVRQMDIFKGCSQLETEEQRLSCFVSSLKDFSQPVREALYFKFASLFAKQAIPSVLKVRDSVIDLAIQTEFTKPKLVA